MRTGSGAAQRVAVKCLSEVLLPSGGTHICVLVFVDSVEVEGLVIDEEFCTGDADGTNTHRQRIVIHISTLSCEPNLYEAQLMRVKRLKC